MSRGGGSSGRAVGRKSVGRGSGALGGGRPAERGSAPLELVVLALPMLAVMMFIAFAGRVVRADGTLDGVAHAAARRAAVARSADDAEVVARDGVESDLAAARLPCEATEVEVDTGRYGPGGMVEVRVRCELRLSDLAPLPLPGVRVVTARAVSPVDAYRGTT